MGTSDKYSNSSRPRILIIEDAKGIADMYREELAEQRYDVRVCTNGKDALTLIGEGYKCELAIVDIVLPPEDMENLTLADCQETGIRLIEAMSANDTCRRFYVITVARHLRNRLEELAESQGVVMRFEYKLDHDPENFSSNVAELLDRTASE